MNARRDQASPLATIHANPLASLRASAVAIADLAFGDAIESHAPDDAGRHLALLTADTLQLDLADPAQRQFGDYELLEQIGEGGMGVVYRAHQRSLDRDVAVKLLAAGPWASREFVERFRREAQNAARMQHPNIVAIHEVGSAEELHFFSMRLVRGGSLAALLKSEGKLAPSRAAQMLRTIAEAVDYAHRLGVLHLDLKPANVLLDEDGSPHVADFGLARRLDSALASGDDEVSGTPSYMAPEQASPRAARISPATDIWGLGAILYELVTGQPPFLGKSPHETLMLVVEGSLRSPRRIVPTLSRDLEAIILKCMAHDARERYPTARALADDLGRFVDGYEVRARPMNRAQRVARWVKRQPYVAAFAALFVLALIAGIVGVTLQWRQARANATLAQDTLWSSRTANAQRQIAEGDAYKALRETVANLREMEAKGASGQVALQRLRIGTVLANAPQLIDTISLVKDQIAALAVAPDGKSFAGVDNKRTVYLVDVASGSLRWRVDASPKSFGMLMGDGPLELRFSPDGHCLIGFTKTDFAAAASILRPHHIDNVMIDVDNGRVVEPPAEFADFLATDFADDGRYALLFDKQGYAQRWRTLPWAPAGDRVKLEGNINLDDKKFSALLGEALLAGDDDDLVVLASDANLTFRVFDAEHLRVRHTLQLTSAQGRASSWMLDRGHKHLAIGTMTGQIAIWNLETNDVAWLQPHVSGWISMLGFSNDDSRLAVVSNEPNELRVFDARSGALAAMPVTLGNDATPGAMNDVEFGPDAYTVLTRRWSTYATLWRLPEPGFPLRAPIAAVPIMAGFASRFALASDARSHLMVTTDNGLIKLWRVRWSPLADRVAAPMVADTLRFGGQYLVAADANTVSVFDVQSGKAAGTPITLAQAPTFAGLSGDGKQLFAVAGRELSCWDWRDATPCWPALALPDSPLRLSVAANAPLLAISTGANEDGGFFEHVKLIDLASGRQRVADVVLPGRLAALRLSDRGQRMLAWRDYMSYDKQSNRLYVIDTATGSVSQQLDHEGALSIIDAQFADDDSIWSLAGGYVAGSDDGKEVPYYASHWNTAGSIVAKTSNSGSEFRLLPLPGNRGVIDTQNLQWIGPTGQTRQLDAPQPNGRVNASALSADGTLLALAMLDGVALIDIASNERLVPNFNLPLPNHDAVQQLAFAPDGSRLVGRTLSGHWFQWRLAADKRPVEAIEQTIQLYDFSDRGLTDKGESLPPLPDDQRRLLRDADPGPAPDAAPVASTATVPAPAPDARYRPLDLDAVANVEPREPMNRVTRIPPQPQSLPTLPRGLQRYDGVDFLLGRAVQLSGTPHNLLDVEFPARSARLDIGTQRIAAVDVLVLQFKAVNGEIGAVLLDYADGGEAKLPILAGRDTARHWNDADALQARIGWMGNFSGAMHGYGMVSSGEETFTRSYVVHLTHPDPTRAVKAITLSAPPSAAPGLLFLAVTIEPVAGDAKVTNAGR